MSDQRPDPVLDELGALPEHDVDPWRRERIRARAKAAMRREADPAARWLSRLERLYARTLEPVVVFGIGGMYLVWAVRSVVDLLG